MHHSWLLYIFRNKYNIVLELSKLVEYDILCNLTSDIDRLAFIDSSLWIMVDQRNI